MTTPAARPYPTATITCSAAGSRRCRRPRWFRSSPWPRRGSCGRAAPVRARRACSTRRASGNVVYAANAAGNITGFDAAKGGAVAKLDAGQRLSGGVGAGGGLIFAGTSRGEVLAFEPQGKQLWKAQLTGEVLAPPVGAGRRRGRALRRRAHLRARPGYRQAALGVPAADAGTADGAHARRPRRRARRGVRRLPRRAPRGAGCSPTATSPGKA